MGGMIPVLIDCDPGHDDAVALVLAFGCGKLDVLGVTTVAGNGTAADTHRNALRVMSVIGRRVEVARGAEKPILRPLVTAARVHGESGLDGPVPFEPTLESSRRTAFDLITETLLGAEGRTVVVATGPLTNVAIALLARPAIADKIERIVLMGGAARDGNVTPAAEFNIATDPEAARIVFESGIPVTMVGLDVTHEALVFPDEVDRLRGTGRVGAFVGELMDFYSVFYRSQGFPGNPVHDALAVASVFEPRVVKTRDLHVGIETRGELTCGRTVADFRGVTGKRPNARVALEVDREFFIRLLLDAVRVLDAAGPAPGR